MTEKTDRHVFIKEIVRTADSVLVIGASLKGNLMTAIRVLFLIWLLVLQMSTNLFGQTIHCDSVYTMVDEVPTFKNGYDDLSFYLRNLDYGSCGPHETVVLTWTIDSSGQMINIDAPGLEGECRSRIIGQLAEFPRWNPARLMGIPVCFKMTIKRSAKTE